MNELKIKIKHCYGIKKLEEKLCFGDKSIIAIYAANGTMKTSFAKTFQDFNEGKSSKNAISSAESICTITDENNKNVKNIYVVKDDDVCKTETYVEKYKTKEMMSLLVSEELQKQYVQINKKIDDLKLEFIDKLFESAGFITKSQKNEVENIIKKDFDDDFYNILETNQTKVSNRIMVLEDIKYNEIFNEKTKKILNDENFIDNVKEYITSYESLLKKSKYLQKNFNHNNATNIKTNLVDNKFFDTKHYLTFCSDTDTKIITDEDGYMNIINEELSKIQENPKIKLIWDKIDDKLDKNKETRKFRDALYNNPNLLTSLQNTKQLSQDIWASYFIIHDELFTNLLCEYCKGKKELKKIYKTAEKEKSEWDRIINEFNDRFDFPFNIIIKNRKNAILNIDVPKPEFEYNGKSVGEEMVQDILSSGQKRALYILHFLFNIEALVKANRDTLLVLDDIVDSFDYKNKHRIIQYIEEISRKSIFKIILLTHNFDFFRTIRLMIGYHNCHIGYVYDDEIKLKKAESVLDPLKPWTDKPNVLTHIIPIIPFARNIIKYTHGEENDGYKNLTSLVHYKSDTSKIYFKNLKDILIDVLPKIKPNIKDEYWEKLNDCQIINKIFDESDNFIKDEHHDNSLEKKIILSIAIRLKTDQYLRNNIKELTITELDKLKTKKLLEQYQKENENISENVLKIISDVLLITQENIHINSFMYEPILDMSIDDLVKLYKNIKTIE